MARAAKYPPLGDRSIGGDARYHYGEDYPERANRETLLIVQIEHPKPGTSLIAKDDVKLRASIRTLSGSPVRPHGDWDSRKLTIYGEVLLGDRVLERIQMFHVGSKSSFEAPFFVPRAADAPNGVTLRVVASDRSGGHFGMGETHYPVLSERLTPATP